jgi:hypothetical protein
LVPTSKYARDFSAEVIDVAISHVRFLIKNVLALCGRGKALSSAKTLSQMNKRTAPQVLTIVFSLFTSAESVLF